MKKLFIALLMIIGAVAFAPKAEAGQYAKVWNGRCYTYVLKSQLYGSGYRCAPTYRTTYRRPAPVYYSQPVRTYRSYGSCNSPVRYYGGGSRFSVNFGF